MNNDTNNGLNGQVLGSVSTNNNEVIDTLDSVNPQTVESTSNNINGNTVVTPQNIGTPSFTNPDSIVKEPMPGFESNNAVGVNPPISLEPEKKPEKKPNKVGFIILMLLVIALVGGGTYYVLHYTDLLKFNNQVNFTVNEIEHNLGESLSTNITDYAQINGTDSNNCSIDTLSVNVYKEGVYNYTVTCGETVKTGHITIVDNRELIVDTKKVYAVKGSEIDAKEFIVDSENYDSIEYSENTNINEIINKDPGEYSVYIKVVSGKKVKESIAKLVVLASEVKGMLSCSTNSQIATDVDAEVVVIEQFIIVKDGPNAYGDINYEVYTFKFRDETEYNEYVKSYEEKKTISISDISGDTKFDNDNQTIIITKIIDKETVISQYGEENLKNYSTINQYFKKTLGYSCTYDKLN